MSNHVDSDESDAAVIVQSMRSPERFAVIFDRHADVIHRYFVRRAGVGDAEDLVSDLFVVAFERRGKYDQKVPNALPWLYGIAGHLVQRRTRSAASAQRLLRNARRVTEFVAGPHDDAVAASVDDAAELKAVAGVVGSLSEGDREALLLFAWEQLSYSEIAMATNVPVGTVRSRIHRARAQLRDGLDATTTKEASN